MHDDPELGAAAVTSRGRREVVRELVVEGRDPVPARVVELHLCFLAQSQRSVICFSVRCGLHLLRTKRHPAVFFMYRASVDAGMPVISESSANERSYACFTSVEITSATTSLVILVGRPPTPVREVSVAF
jgi:hypothetical protein